VWNEGDKDLSCQDLNSSERHELTISFMFMPSLSSVSRGFNFSSMIISNLRLACAVGIGAHNPGRFQEPVTHPSSPENRASTRRHHPTVCPERGELGADFPNLGIEILNIYPAQDLFEWFDDCGRKKKWMDLRKYLYLPPRGPSGEFHITLECCLVVTR
jgi:hypothetical protein